MLRTFAHTLYRQLRERSWADSTAPHRQDTDTDAAEVSWVLARDAGRRPELGRHIECLCSVDRLPSRVPQPRRVASWDDRTWVGRSSGTFNLAEKYMTSEPRYRACAL